MPAEGARPGLGCILLSCSGRWLSFFMDKSFDFSVSYREDRDSEAYLKISHRSFLLLSALVNVGLNYVQVLLLLLLFLFVF